MVRWAKWFSVVLMVCCAAAFADDDLYAQYPKIDYGTGEHAELVKQGEYLVKASDCIACHTTEADKPFAGGVPIKTPFGTFYSPNITPDKETGIGGWTDAQFVRLFKKGIRADGSHAFPTFPFLYYSKMTEEDILAIKAYMDAVPAIHQPGKKDEVPFPFNIRFLQLGWKILFFYPYNSPFKHDDTQTDQWNRGAYLVEGAAHCSMCHTPINILGAPKRSQYLTGNTIDGYYAPPITGTYLKGVEVDQVVNVFLRDQKIAGGEVQGPMKQVNCDSLHYLKRDDLEAIATYILSVKSKEIKISQDNVGKSVYQNYCAACHNNGAGGAPVVTDESQWEYRLKLGKDKLYHNAIYGYHSMPAKGGCISCSDDDIKGAVDYIFTLLEGGSSRPKGDKPKVPTLENGQQVYEAVCSICHEGGALGAASLDDHPYWNNVVEQGMDTLYTHTLEGYGNMPAKGACVDCDTVDVMSAVNYMIKQGTTEGNYVLWQTKN